LCDPSGCYITWRVVDSDRDGVSDADEIMAGTDPHDPLSRPGLSVIVEVGQRRELPSFEAGLGVFVLFPPEIVEIMAEAHPDLLAAFDMSSRKDAISRLGINAEQMAAAGVDVDRTGMTIGLDRPASGGVSGLPGRRVSGMDMRLISAGGNDGGNSSKTWVIGGSDGSKTTWTDQGGGHYQGVRTNPDGSPGTTRDVMSTTKEYGDGSATQTTSETASEGGKLVSQTTTTTTTGKGQATTTEKTTRTYVRDANGKVTGQRVTTTRTSTSADGKQSFTVTEDEQCDANGNGCVPATDEPEQEEPEDEPEHDDGDGGDHHDDDDGHFDPEQAEQYVITPEMVDGALRLRGAAVTVVQGWTAPGDDEPDNPYDDGTIVLVDPDQAMTFTVLNAPRVTSAQPERRPGLPDPLQAAPFPDGGSDGSCQTRLC
jgi:hypothetical protein